MEAAHLPWQHLGSLLINRGLLTVDQVKQAFEEQRLTGRRLGFPTRKAAPSRQTRRRARRWTEQQDPQRARPPNRERMMGSDNLP